MTHRFGTRLGAAVLVGAVALQLTGCSATIKSKSTIRPEGAAKSVTDLVSEQTGFQPTDVTCPSDVEAKVGGEFECHFTGPEGKPYTAHMKITKIDGEDVIFDIKTRPS
jgi:Domain of unknown function (DUF4333)